MMFPVDQPAKVIPQGTSSTLISWEESYRFWLSDSLHYLMILKWPREEVQYNHSSIVDIPVFGNYAPISVLACEYRSLLHDLQNSHEPLFYVCAYHSDIHDGAPRFFYMPVFSMGTEQVTKNEMMGIFSAQATVLLALKLARIKHDQQNYQASLAYSRVALEMSLRLLSSQYFKKSHETLVFLTCAVLLPSYSTMEASTEAIDWSDADFALPEYNGIFTANWYTKCFAWEDLTEQSINIPRVADGNSGIFKCITDMVIMNRTMSLDRNRRLTFLLAQVATVRGRKMFLQVYEEATLTEYPDWQTLVWVTRLLDYSRLAFKAQGLRNLSAHVSHQMARLHCFTSAVDDETIRSENTKKAENFYREAMKCEDECGNSRDETFYRTMYFEYSLTCIRRLVFEMDLTLSVEEKKAKITQVLKFMHDPILGHRSGYIPPSRSGETLSGAAAAADLSAQLDAFARFTQLMDGAFGSSDVSADPLDPPREFGALPGQNCDVLQLRLTAVAAMTVHYWIQTLRIFCSKDCEHCNTKAEVFRSVQLEEALCRLPAVAFTCVAFFNDLATRRRKALTGDALSEFSRSAQLDTLQQHRLLHSTLAIVHSLRNTKTCSSLRQ